MMKNMVMIRDEADRRRASSCTIVRSCDTIKGYNTSLEGQTAPD